MVTGFTDRIRRLLAAPVFPDEEQTRRADLLNLLLVGTFGVVVLYAPIALIIGQDVLARLVVMGGLAGAALALRWLLGIGRVRLSSFLYPSFLWLFVTGAALFSGGVRTPSFASYTMIVLIAGLLLGVWPGIIFSMMSVLAGLVMLAAELQGVFPEPAFETTLRSTWAGLSMNFLMAPVLVTLALRSVNQALERARRNERALGYSNRLLQARSHELEQRERSLRRVSRAYLLLSEGNQVIARSTDEMQLLEEICRRIVEYGGYRMAWVGYRQEDEASSVRPVAQKGFEAGYLERLDITWADSRLGRGPTGIALRTGQPAIARDLQNDPDYQPWREEALSRGYASSVALPLSDRRSTFGALNIYSADVDAFDQAEMELLVELAQDLAYGVTALRTQHALRDSESRYRLLVDYSPDGIGIHAQGILLFANPAAARLLGAQDPGELIGKPIQRFVHPDGWPQAQDRIRRLLAGEEGLYPAEDRYVRLDGQVIPVEVTAAPLEFEGQAAVQVIVRDVSERQRLTDEVQRRLNELTAVHQAGQKLQRLHNPEVLAGEVIQVLEDTLKYDFGAVLLVDENDGQLNPFALSDHRQGPDFVRQDKELIKSQGLRAGQGITGWVVEHGQSVRVGDVTQDTRYYPLRANIRSELCVPLLANDRVLGVINVESKLPDAFSQEDQRVLETIASQITVAIQNAHLFNSIQQHSQRLRALAVRLAEVEETQRRRLAQELHDQVGQNLTALSINLNMAQSLLPPDSPQAFFGRLDESQLLVEQTAERIRDVMGELRPPVLDDYGLLPALRWLGEQFSERTGVAVSLRSLETTPRLPGTIETALYRIAQEGLNNVIKHAHASQVEIALETLPGGTRMTLADNGRGFQPGKKNRPGWGLTIIQERAESVGGRFSITSKPGEGTRLVVSFER